MRRVIGFLGRSCITVGILILLFVAYQLWGTGLYTSREQERLREEFTKSLQADAGPSSTTTSTSGPEPIVTTTTAPPPPPPPATQGEAVALLHIPKIGADDIVVEGVSREALRKGPGRYPNTPFPGQEGNAAIAGHRTTYGAPFADLDQLTAGDEIVVQTVQGTFTYEVYEDPLIVSPDNLGVLEPEPNRPATLTLTTCNPKYSASQRLVIKAELELEGELEPLPATVTEAPVAVIHKAVLSGEGGSQLPAGIAGVVTALIGGLWWLVFHRHPSWRTWLIGAVPFAIALAFFYVYIERLLPANY